ncbi:hypothetical protein D477_002673 [Arthrobacter crystallopoietes BAB-32]|uniref:Helix-turn-helix domain-containing protein n=1 Tax=Arthrobacter crystallopoietes BAB-32 TaxID=1246476 RepID=N1UZE5_9MICC|nr:helix-turn-helix domain-containing protein [Arthrobacter crystallopoietes]EMY35761.1 hypothetical protein D477_002673 [Arthrobacter crystallopoietes BAB-32]
MATQLPRNANPPVFTPQTAAEYLGATERQIYDAVRKKRITHVKVGQYVRFRESDLQEYIQRQTVLAEPLSQGAR